MGACMSSGARMRTTKMDMAMHNEVEERMKEAKVKFSRQRKILLLGLSGSGKSTIMKQMRIIHQIPFSPHEVQTYRQLVFNNLIHGLKCLLDAMENMGLKVSEDNTRYLDLIVKAMDIQYGEPFPNSCYEPLKSLWADPSVQRGWERENEAALPENLWHFFSSLDRLFDPTYQPTEQDILYCRARTTGITELSLPVRDHELLMVDIGGQRGERRKWIDRFQDVSGIIFLVSLSGYDQCLMEDKNVNQLQEAMTVWDSICRSRWFTYTPMILFLNKNDLFERKVPTSNIKDFFPDFEGAVGDVQAGRRYIKWRFSKDRHAIYSSFTTAVDTVSMRNVMSQVEE